MTHFELYLNRKQLFKWRLRAGNGEIIATCGKQEYSHRKDCLRTVNLINPDLPIEDLTKGKLK